MRILSLLLLLVSTVSQSLLYGVPSVSASLDRDDCPNGDNSISYYDGECDATTGGGGGGGSQFVRDVCPNGDNTASYYDGLCNYGDSGGGGSQPTRDECPNGDNTTSYYDGMCENDNTGFGYGGGGGGSHTERDYCPNGDNTVSYYDGECEPDGSYPSLQKDICTDGDNSGSFYDGTCIARQIKDICPSGDYSFSYYDGRCEKYPIDQFTRNGCTIQGNIQDIYDFMRPGGKFSLQNGAQGNLVLNDNGTFQRTIPGCTSGEYQFEYEYCEDRPTKPHHPIHVVTTTTTTTTVCPMPTCGEDSCGIMVNSCGNSTDCGTCPITTTTVCPIPTCGEDSCGIMVNSCGNSTDCGTCPTTTVCPTPVCGENMCGTLLNTCGNSTDCGACTIIDTTTDTSTDTTTDTSTDTTTNTSTDTSTDTTTDTSTDTTTDTSTDTTTDTSTDTTTDTSTDTTTNTSTDTTTDTSTDTTTNTSTDTTTDTSTDTTTDTSTDTTTDTSTDTTTDTSTDTTTDTSTDTTTDTSTDTSSGSGGGGSSSNYNPAIEDENDTPEVEEEEEEEEEEETGTITDIVDDMNSQSNTGTNSEIYETGISNENNDESDDSSQEFIEKIVATLTEGSTTTEGESSFILPLLLPQTGSEDDLLHGSSDDQELASILEELFGTTTTSTTSTTSTTPTRPGNGGGDPTRRGKCRTGTVQVTFGASECPDGDTSGRIDDHMCEPRSCIDGYVYDEIFEQCLHEDRVDVCPEGDQSGSITDNMCDTMICAEGFTYDAYHNFCAPNEYIDYCPDGDQTVSVLDGICSISFQETILLSRSYRIQDNIIQGAKEVLALNVDVIPNDGPVLIDGFFFEGNAQCGDGLVPEVVSEVQLWRGVYPGGILLESTHVEADGTVNFMNFGDLLIESNGNEKMYVTLSLQDSIPETVSETVSCVGLHFNSAFAVNGTDDNGFSISHNQLGDAGTNLYIQEAPVLQLQADLLDETTNSSKTVTAGEQSEIVGGFIFNAQYDDIYIEDLRIEISGEDSITTASAIDFITLYDEGQSTTIITETVNGSSVYFNNVNLVIPKGTSKKLHVTVQTDPIGVNETGLASGPYTLELMVDTSYAEGIDSGILISGQGDITSGPTYEFIIIE